MLVRESQLTKDVYKPVDISRILKCTVRTVQIYCNQGKLVCYRSPGGRRLVDKQELVSFLKSIDLYVNDVKSIDDRIDIIYARVSTHKQEERGDLDRQVEKISTFAITQNPYNLKIYKEVGSGLNDSRKKLLEIIDLVLSNKISRIFILYKDRLTRFGYNYLKSICSKYNTKIVIVSDEQNDKSIQEELAEDIIAIIHSFSGKLYGMRRGVKERINKELQEEI